MVGSVVIVVGVTFISVLVAIVTSYFVSAEQEERAERERDSRAAEVTGTLDALRRIEQRLDAIESRLGG